MTIENDWGRQPNRVGGLKDAERDSITEYLKGLVYCWCKNKPDKWFAARDLLGGVNRNWKGTPVQKLYKLHTDLGKSHEQAVIDAGKDVGHLLRRFLKDDSRVFKASQGYTREYCWLGPSSSGAQSS